MNSATNTSLYPYFFDIIIILDVAVVTRVSPGPLIPRQPAGTHIRIKMAVSDRHFTIYENGAAAVLVAAGTDTLAEASYLRE